MTKLPKPLEQMIEMKAEAYTGRSSKDFSTKICKECGSVHIKCPECGHQGKPIQKPSCYICAKCRVVLGYGKLSCVCDKSKYTVQR